MTAVFYLGTLSPNPWDLSLLRQNVAQRAACAAQSFRPLSRRSGRIPALPYPPHRLGQYKSVTVRCRKNICPNDLPQGINTLVLVPLRWPLLKCPCMAGFQVSTEAEGRTNIDALAAIALYLVAMRCAEWNRLMDRYCALVKT